MKCDVCGGKARVEIPYENLALCEHHFVQRYRRRVLEFIRKFDLLEKGDKVLVLVSGGKDSMSTLHILKELEAHVGHETVCAFIDEGIGDYRKGMRKNVERFSRELGVPFHHLEFSEVFGATLDEMVEDLGVRPCTLCGLLKRYLANRFAREIGATKVATGHNMDDCVQTFVMNLIRNDILRLFRSGPLAGVLRHEKFVPRIKPLYAIPERENVIYAIINNIPFSSEPCPNIVWAQRAKVKPLIFKMEEKEPGSRERAFELFMRIWEISRGSFKAQISSCKLCGEPSSGEVCMVCQILRKLGLRSSWTM